MANAVHVKHVCAYLLSCMLEKVQNRLDEANYIPANQSHIYSTYSAEKSEYHISDRKITMIMFHIDQFCGWEDYPTLTISLGIISTH